MKEHEFTLVLTADPNEEEADKMYGTFSDGTIPNLDGPDRSIMSTEFAHSRNGMFEIDRPGIAGQDRDLQL